MQYNNSKIALVSIIASLLLSLMIFSQLAEAASEPHNGTMQPFNLDWRTDMMNPFTLPMHIKNRSTFIMIKNFETSVEIEASLSGEVKYHLKPGQSALLSTNSDDSQLTIKPRYTGQALGTASVQLN